MWGIVPEIIEKNNEGIHKISLTIFKGTEVFRKLNVIVGNTYIVDPVKKNKKKHRDRFIKVHSFEEDYKGKLRVKVKFIDTGRLGYVELDDVQEIIK